MEVQDLIGNGFLNNRYMYLFLLGLPLIAIMERYGLKERAAEAIQKIKSASAGAVIGLYIVIRTVAAALSLRLGGHIQFIRPIILPMAQGAAEKNRKLTDEEVEQLKALAGASENYGNFFGQNIFPVSSGVLLMQGVLAEAGYNVTAASIANTSIFAGVAMIVIALIQCYFFERKIRKGDKNV
ncbi:5-oxoproline transporter, DUF969 family subunit [Anaerococcus porci]|uniref:5-oxoproline transporter, DUF969 family subunit n=1 Tax=Anaerococcus porci TaxID=2652269 RepID=UPI002A7599F0|nr:DUF969 family protein [Anaerococcus porci]MDY3006328.1 DUF969 family protein [Anaerococcus porci]